jgi:hypothetical protein
MDSDTRRLEVGPFEDLGPSVADIISIAPSAFAVFAGHTEA